MKTSTWFASMLVGVSLIGMSLGGLARADAAQEITWERLVPPQSETLMSDISALQETFDGLDSDEQELYFQIDDQTMLRHRVELGFVDKSQLNPKSLAFLEQNLRGENPEIASLWDRIEVVRELYAAESKKVDASLNGKTVRMPGYVLPLETEGTSVKEFLLVPFVGACIHVPPPPPNQMVHVVADEAFASQGLFEAVMVEGVLETLEGVHSLSLVDGESDVNTGYSMRAVKVVKHTQ